MSSIIESMIKAQEDKTRADLEAKDRERKERAEKLRESLKSALGDFYSVLIERGIPIEVSFGHSGNPSFEIKIPASDEDRLAPISITWDGQLSGGYGYPFHTWGRSYSNLPAALAKAREAYEDYTAKARAEKIDRFEKEISYNWMGRGKTEEEVRALVATHVEEFPDREDEAVSMLEAWLKNRREDLERIEINKREQEEYVRKQSQREAEAKAYIEKLAEWLKARDAVEEANKVYAAGMQNLADLETYRVYKLTFSKVASYFEEGEEEKYLETGFVYTFDERSDSAGYWTVDGKPVRYFFPVKIEPETVKPSSEILAKKVSKSGIDLFFHPETPDEEIEEIISRIQDLPEAPEFPSSLPNHYGAQGDYIQKARRLLSGGEDSFEDYPDF